MSKDNSKKCKVVMLSTEKASQIVSNGDQLEFCFKEGIPQESWMKPQHLYITNDEEIKEGDYWVNLDKNQIFYGNLYDLANNAPSCKKIIATTDPELKVTYKSEYQIEGTTSWNLPKPTEGFIKKFIEKYNKGEIITDILVEYIDKGNEEWLGDDINGEPFWNEKWELKLSFQNEITIHSVKQSWTREEVINLIRKYSLDSQYGKGLGFTDKWIGENL